MPGLPTAPVPCTIAVSLTGGKALARQRVVLLDGTGNRIGIQPSYIARMLPLLDQPPDRQLCHYDHGVGTVGRPGVLFEWQNLPARLLGLAFGWGTRITVERAYRFLCEHHRPGDDIYLFGFSRGAYAARLLAAMVHRYGLLPPQHLHQFPPALNALAHRVGGFGRMGWIRRAYAGRPVTVRLLGLYDTVNSTGWISNPHNVPNTVNNRSVENVRHALSLDQRRSFFNPMVWGPAGNRPYHPDAAVQHGCTARCACARSTTRATKPGLSRYSHNRSTAARGAGDNRTRGSH